MPLEFFGPGKIHFHIFWLAYRFLNWISTNVTVVIIQLCMGVCVGVCVGGWVCALLYFLLEKCTTYHESPEQKNEPIIN